MKFTLPFDVYNSTRLTTRNILNQSKIPEIRNLYKGTAPKIIEVDTIFHQHKPKNPKHRLVNKSVNKILDGMKGLNEQNNVTDSISQQCSSINQWQKVCKGLPQNIFIFVCKVTMLQLADNKTYLDGKKFSRVTVVCVTPTNTTAHAKQLSRSCAWIHIAPPL